MNRIFIKDRMTREKWLGSVFFILIGMFANTLDAFVGINIGTAVSNLPSAPEIVNLLKAKELTHVRLYDADSRMLKALSGTGIQVMVGVTNDQVLALGQSPAAAAAWITRNVGAYLPSTNITAIAVGSQVLTSAPTAAPYLVRAMKNLHSVLVSANLNHRIKITAPQSMDVIPKPFPPSAAVFEQSGNSTVDQILRFLKNTDSFYSLNAFPYYGYVRGDGLFPIEYALFKPLPPAKQIVDPNTLFHYNSMLDAMVDAAYFSISASNFTGIPIIVTETGWPWFGGAKDPDATLDNAEAFAGNLVRRVLNGTGPPGQRSYPINAYIYEMFNEDMWPGSDVERSFGVVFTNGTGVYPLDLSGFPGRASGNGSEAKFCVAKSGADPEELRVGLDWACGQGQANCSYIQSGQPCFFPNNLVNHASYAFNSYYQKSKSIGGTCDFGGTATLVDTDPSYGSCIFAGSSNSTRSGGFSPPSGVTPDLSLGSWSSDLRVSKLQLLIPPVLLGLVFF